MFNWQIIETPEITEAYNKKRQWLIRIFLAVVSVLVFVIWYFKDMTKIYPLLFPLILFFAGLIYVRTLLNFKAEDYLVNDEGISISAGKNVSHFKWDSIIACGDVAPAINNSNAFTTNKTTLSKEAVIRLLGLRRAYMGQKLIFLTLKPSLFTTVDLVSIVVPESKFPEIFTFIKQKIKDNHPKKI